MTLEQALDILENLNKWRRGAHDSTQVGLAIDFVIKFVKNTK